MLELSKTMGKGKKRKEFREHKMVEFNTDRYIFKGHSTSFMFEEKFEEIVSITTLKLKEMIRLANSSTTFPMISRMIGQ